MAVAFSAEERARIRDELLATGEKLFATQGLKKTSLDELVAPSGIAKGSFYAFFESKEALYAEVMVARAPMLGARLTAALDRPPGVDALVGIMRGMVELLGTDPFYRRLMERPDELEAVTRRVGPEEIARVTPHLVTPLTDYLAAGQRAGVFTADVPPQTLIGVLRTAGLLVLNRDRYGDDYEQVVDTTITALAKGLLA
ncbi:TetR/AcrR family transcriptional regulator [Nonomuraea sediminis]|uniref:TetR/AcrR family transcriptional regulator n=1 Tax=Nonomuraea sediminis TaxID=2835864 RepID=UPI001BDC29FE|nr:TetR/AcrR family transcriptional regulator [Nonomuraea sediminis]